MDFDIATSQLIGSDNAFSIFFDTPTVRTLTFFNDGRIRVNNPATPLTGTIGSFTDGVSQHVGMNFDIGNNQWDIFVDDTLLYRAALSAASLRSIRFSHGLINSTTGIDPSSTTYIDNVLISAVPVPAAVWLFATALLGLVGFGKRGRAR